MARQTKKTRDLSSIAILASLVALSACSPPGFTLSTGPQQTTLVGRFGGEARGDAGCAWIETNSGERVEVTYPNGWRLDFNPPALYDDSGRQRAKSEDTLTIKGYFVDVGASVCRPQRMFNTTEVSGP